MYNIECGRKFAYSSDIKWRVVWRRLGMEMTYKDIGKGLHIAPSTAHRISKLLVMSIDMIVESMICSIIPVSQSVDEEPGHVFT